jgi:hypothetical protein
MRKLKALETNFERMHMFLFSDLPRIVKSGLTSLFFMIALFYLFLNDVWKCKLFLFRLHIVDWSLHFVHLRVSRRIDAVSKFLNSRRNVLGVTGVINQRPSYVCYAAGFPCQYHSTAASN